MKKENDQKKDNGNYDVHTSGGTPHVPITPPPSVKKGLYHGFCSKCNYSWNSSSKPTSCPKCGNTGIVIS